MELPTYRMPTIRNIIHHMWDKTHHYIKKIGSVILIGVVIIWALEYFPRHTEKTELFNNQITDIKIDLTINEETKQEETLIITHKIEADRLENSYLGRLGKLIQPVMRPLGFDWKMSISLLAGLPAKEIIVSTMGVLYQSDSGDTINLQNKIKNETFTSGKQKGKKVFNTPSALAFLIFVLIYFPCIGVIATIKNESGHWGWAIFTVFYTTFLAWFAALIVFQVGSLIV
jgi:ferrous iron transport protein B